MKEYKHLSFEEREKIFVLKNDGKGVNAIGRKIKRPGSAVSRELQRNTRNQRTGYLPDTAHNLSRQRKAKRKLKLERNLELRKKVISQLKIGGSPEVIAGRLK